jgi:hypothetical protein
MRPTAEMPMSAITTATEVNTTSRRSPGRDTRTSPASPEAASMPRNATAASTAANQRSSHSGLVPGSIASITSPGLYSVASPIPMISPMSARFASPTRASRS